MAQEWTLLIHFWASTVHFTDSAKMYVKKVEKKQLQDFYKNHYLNTEIKTKYSHSSHSIKNFKGYILSYSVWTQYIHVTLYWQIQFFELNFCRLLGYVSCCSIKTTSQISESSSIYHFVENQTANLLQKKLNFRTWKSRTNFKMLRGRFSLSHPLVHHVKPSLRTW
jgi:hypothetical protein